MHMILCFDFTFYIRILKGFEDFVVQLRHLYTETQVLLEDWLYQM